MFDGSGIFSVTTNFVTILAVVLPELSMLFFNTKLYLTFGILIFRFYYTKTKNTGGYHIHIIRSWKYQ